MGKIVIWFAKMAGANLLWIVFTLLGFVLFGLAPSTIALLQVTKEMKYDEDKPLFRSFMKHYVENFPKANGYGLFLLVVNVSMISGVYYVLSNGWPIYLSAIAGAISLIVFVISIFVFPTYVYFEATFVNHLKIAGIIALVHPTVSFVVITVIAVGYFILFQSTLLLFFPVLFLFFLFSIPAYFIHVILKPVLIKFGQEEENQDPYLQLQQ